MKTSTVLASRYADEASHSFLSRIAGVFGSLASGVQRELKERRVRAELAQLDDRVLSDLGIAPDEIALVRSEARFTPRAWADRAIKSGTWYI